jgi:hypothetical protein
MAHIGSFGCLKKPYGSFIAMGRMNSNFDRTVYPEPEQKAEELHRLNALRTYKTAPRTGRGAVPDFDSGWNSGLTGNLQVLGIELVMHEDGVQNPLL